MHTYVFDISVDNTRTSVTVKARNSFDAKKLVESQYPNCKIFVWSYKQVD